MARFSVTTLFKSLHNLTIIRIHHYSKIQQILVLASLNKEQMQIVPLASVLEFLIRMVLNVASNVPISTRLVIIAFLIVQFLNQPLNQPLNPLNHYRLT